MGSNCEQHPGKIIRKLNSIMSIMILCLCQQVLIKGEAKALLVAGNNISKVNDAQLFYIYYGQSFKVIKHNNKNGQNYLLLHVKANYNCLSMIAANLATRFKPIVAWMQYNQDIWSFVKEDYKLQLVKDTGGENIDDAMSNTLHNASDPEDMENLHAILCTVDVVIDQTYDLEPAEYKLSTFLENMDIGDKSCFTFLTNQSLWRVDKRLYSSGAIDWFDGAISQPQLAIADLIEAFFPTGKYSITYFRNLAKDEEVNIIDPELCDRDLSTPLEPTIVPCQ